MFVHNDHRDCLLKDHYDFLFMPSKVIVAL